jgi:hypothetical protein
VHRPRQTKSRGPTAVATTEGRCRKGSPTCGNEQYGSHAKYDHKCSSQARFTSLWPRCWARPQAQERRLGPLCRPPASVLRRRRRQLPPLLGNAKGHAIVSRGVQEVVVGSGNRVTESSAVPGAAKSLASSVIA